MTVRRYRPINYPTSSTETNDLTAAVTWANVPDANITESSVTQHATAIGGALVLDDISDVTETTITTGDLLRWNGSAWVNYPDSNFQAAGSYLSNVVEDTTPQLGGNLDLNSNTINGTGSIGITGAITATSFGGITSANLLDKSASETVSGEWIFSGSSGIGLNITNVNDVGLATTNHGFQIGTSSGLNVRMDTNEIMAVNNGAASALYINADGGEVNVNNNTAGGLSVRQGGYVRIYDSGNSDYGELTHDGTNFDISSGSADPIRIQAQNGENSIYCFPNGAVYLYYDNDAKIKTQSSAVTGQTTGATIKTHAGAEHDIGTNTLPTFNFNISDTLEASHCGRLTGKINSGSYTLTGPTSSDLDFPVGGVCTVANLGTSVNYTISDTATCTMYYCDGTGAPTDIAGSGTLAPGGVVTLYRYSSSLIYIWGSGFTV